ncbi:hypothetical protein L873DRAFT_1785067 [Choiromyces venosus 120613-1]|uniref:Tc1-like transposase DDE domain-containing protein n=1 Tax=Choiromyces venosus 120613-1 TaxID=1336337 RepID=A0A3N4K5V0_9PEZI|nr:hypothetical protein L873DRAFT_1785067 [Choiromyces venosus 120613-1]
MYGYKGSELPYYLYPTPYESLKQKSDAITQLHHEWDQEWAEVAIYNLTPQGILNGKPLPELKERGKNQKGGIDWFIYRERIQIPLLYPFALTAQVQRPETVIMEDNAPAHIHHYHNLLREQLSLEKIEWPANSLDLNPIETIWCEIKDRIKERLGI